MQDSVKKFKPIRLTLFLRLYKALLRRILAYMYAVTLDYKQPRTALRHHLLQVVVYQVKVVLEFYWCWLVLRQILGSSASAVLRGMLACRAFVLKLGQSAWRLLFFTMS